MTFTFTLTATEETTLQAYVEIVNRLRLPPSPPLTIQTALTAHLQRLVDLAKAANVHAVAAQVEEVYPLVSDADRLRFSQLLAGGRLV